MLRPPHATPMMRRATGSGYGYVVFQLKHRSFRVRCKFLPECLDRICGSMPSFSANRQTVCDNKSAKLPNFRAFAPTLREAAQTFMD